MASRALFINAFDLIGDDECVDVEVLYDRMKKKEADREEVVKEEVASTPSKWADDYELTDGHAENGNVESSPGDDKEKQNGGDGKDSKAEDNGWKEVVYKKGRKNSDGDSNENGLVVEEEAYHGGRSGGGRGRGRGHVPKRSHSNEKQNVGNNANGGPRRHRNGNRNHGGQKRAEGHDQAQNGSEQPEVEGDVNEVHRFGDRTGNGNRHYNGDRRRASGGHRGRGRGRMEYRRVDIGEVKDTSNASDGQSNGNTEGDVVVTKDTGDVVTSEVSKNADAVVTSEVSMDAEAEEKTTTEEASEVTIDPKEAAKAKRQREEEEREKKRREEWERQKKEEREREAAFMTLAQYEAKLAAEKKASKALEDNKAEQRRVAIDKEFEAMQIVKKKQEDGVMLKIEKEKPKKKDGDEKLKKTESFEKKQPVKGVALQTEFFRPAPYRSSRGGRGRGRGDQGDSAGRYPSRDGQRSSDAPQTNERVAPVRRTPFRPARIPTANDFPVLVSRPLTPEAATSTSTPAAAATSASAANCS